ncbi:hypothetical protein LJK88_42520 [Paenibacillus sp. P26]|nr:hypothetical protein LJK88_42520 [Paenibacillus sp. P26]
MRCRVAALRLSRRRRRARGDRAEQGHRRSRAQASRVERRRRRKARASRAEQGHRRRAQASRA